MDLSNIVGLLGRVLGGQAPAAGVAPALASSEALLNALGTVPAGLYGAMQAPLADLMRTSLRGIDTFARAATNDPQALQWVEWARHQAEARIARALELARLLMEQAP
jgi:hypothetical protein